MAFDIFHSWFFFSSVGRCGLSETLAMDQLHSPAYWLNKVRFWWRSRGKYAAIGGVLVHFFLIAVEESIHVIQREKALAVKSFG
jgi:hypothetical protein